MENREYPKQLESGRWMDVNGNSYKTLLQAARAQASAEVYDIKGAEKKDYIANIIFEIKTKLR